MNSDDLRNLFHRYLNFRSTLFAPFQNRELKRFERYFDTIEKQPLTALQRRAVILNDKRNLIVAGAGTGKTSVLIAKAGYLVESGQCKPDEILLLAFNTDAAKELSERCKDRLGVDIRASTFHALGNQIISAVENDRPSLSKLAQDRAAFSRFLDRTIDELRAQPGKWEKVRTFVLAHLKPYKPDTEFKSLAEYAAYVRSVELRALSGDLVKSFAELDIANFLFYNGVKFEYEKRYPHTTDRYHPDFYLPDHGIWIEHFGVDRNGDTAPYIDREQYNQENKWKRSIPSKHGTKLLETYGWQKSEGLLTRALHNRLKDRNVAYTPRSQEEIFQAFKNAGYVTQLAALIETFLSQFKASQLSLAELDRRGAALPDQTRAKAFRALFDFFLERYQAELDGNRPREIDFNDMISGATKYVRDGRFEVPWKYIIVDEFQDISVGRYQLIDSLLKAKRNTRLFAVGDDWQSINRFAGSDISVMRKFRYYFRGARILKLDHTFRFNSSIADVSSTFVQKNPSQIRKTISTDIQSSDPKVFAHWKGSNQRATKLRDAHLVDLVTSISRTLNQDDPSLLIVSRYNHQIPNRTLLARLEKLWPGPISHPLSIHRAKGTEADYVIVSDLSADRYGFPAEMADDPLIGLVLARPDQYPHAEERRLLYVALTRARREAHLIIDQVQPSSFALELRDDNYAVQQIDGSTDLGSRCPECRSGVILRRTETLASCSNFPFCEFRAPQCKDCAEGHLVLKEAGGRSQYQCTSTHCRERLSKCPKCGIGALVSKGAVRGGNASCHRSPRCDFVLAAPASSPAGTNGMP